MRADKVLVMKKGRVREEGSHESLLRDYPDGVYAGLVDQYQNVVVDPVAEF